LDLLVCLITVDFELLSRELTVKTITTKAADIQREWFVVDAEGKTLGRLASRIAAILKGKHKPMYTPWLDTGDYVIVINVDKLRVTGRKLDQKIYYHHSGYPGGMKSVSLRDQLNQHPDRVLKAAVRGMLPHNRLGRVMFKKLKVYRGAEHPHAAQKPQQLDVMREGV
jgi:large subunit ribosomal protein L13